MRDFIAALGLSLTVTIGGFLLLAYGLSVKAEELPKELTLKTVTGEVVLTVNPCNVVNEHGFEYEAYATDGAVVHKGCWYRDHDIVNILFPFEEPAPLIATFRDHLFVPRK
jgi:hypothetical protein